MINSLTRRDILKKGSLLSILAIAPAVTAMSAEKKQISQASSSSTGQDFISNLCQLTDVYVYGPSAFLPMHKDEFPRQVNLAINSKGKIEQVLELANSQNYSVRLVPLGHGVCIVAAKEDKMITVYDVDHGDVIQAMADSRGTFYSSAIPKEWVAKLDKYGRVCEKLNIPYARRDTIGSGVYGQSRAMADKAKFSLIDSEVVPHNKYSSISRDELICFAIEDLPYVAMEKSELVAWAILDDLARSMKRPNENISNRILDSVSKEIPVMAALADKFAYSLDVTAVDLSLAYGRCSRIPLVGSFTLRSA